MPSQWPLILLPSQLSVISTLPPHTQVALTRPVQAAHSNKRLQRMRREWMVAGVVPGADGEITWEPSFAVARRKDRAPLPPRQSLATTGSGGGAREECESVEGQRRTWKSLQSEYLLRTQVDKYSNVGVHPSFFPAERSPRWCPGVRQLKAELADTRAPSSSIIISQCGS